MTPPFTAFALSFLTPALMLFLGLYLALKWAGVEMKQSGRCAALLLFSLGTMAVPIQGLCVARWLAGVIPGFSIPLLALLGHATLRCFGKAGLLRERELQTAWLFGAGAGLVLYPLALGLGPVDPYAAGWRFGALFVTMGILAAGWIACGNRFGWVLVAAILLCNLRLLESANFWDYLVDPIFALLALPIVLTTGFRRLHSRTRRVEPN